MFAWVANGNESLGLFFSLLFFLLIKNSFFFSLSHTHQIFWKNSRIFWGFFFLQNIYSHVFARLKSDDALCHGLTMTEVFSGLTKKRYFRPNGLWHFFLFLFFFRSVSFTLVDGGKVVVRRRRRWIGSLTGYSEWLSSRICVAQDWFHNIPSLTSYRKRGGGGPHACGPGRRSGATGVMVSGGDSLTVGSILFAIQLLGYFTSSPPHLLLIK